jgi:SAM-dependent methyltransferase
MSKRARFDQLSGSYDELLRDPIRDRFTGAESAFFHHRKRDLIRDYFRRRSIDAANLSYLDFGCGKGELLSSLSSDFRRAAGCDISAGMIESVQGVETRLQQHPMKIPFEDASFDFVTAVCVYHHVPLESRLDLTREIYRAVKPGGIFGLIEHNPLNPATRLIVSRTPVDADAILLHSSESRGLLKSAGFTVDEQEYFLYLPEKLYRRGTFVERILRKVPLGGQYAIFATKPSRQ